MEKYIPILLTTSLFLSACSIIWNDGKDKKILQPQEQTIETKAVTETEAKETKIRKCEAQAWEYFQNSSPETINENWKLNDNSLIEHYNSKLNKCFAKILQFRSTPKKWITSDPIIVSGSGRSYPKNPESLSTMWMSVVVTDISEGKIYGEYSEKIIKEWEPKIIQCKIDKECSNQDDFEEYILPYMKD